MPYPDILCIGAPKAGTSWLYQNVKQHPEIWLPPMKEIHYFDFRHFTRRDVIKAILRERGHLRHAAVRILKPSTSLGDRKLLLRYVSNRRSEEWYQSLFASAGVRKTGDFTPAYSRLRIADIAYIQERMPAAKIIYLLRNPVERAWSNAAMHFTVKRRRDPRECLDEVVAFLASQADLQDRPEATHHKSSDYLGTLSRWETFYPREQVFIGFLDEIESVPERFLSRVFEFLEIDRSFVSPFARTRFNKGRAGSVPSSIAPLLADMYRPAVLDLHARFNNEYTWRWLSWTSG